MPLSPLVAEAIARHPVVFSQQSATIPLFANAAVPVVEPTLTTSNRCAKLCYQLALITRGSYKLVLFGVLAQTSKFRSTPTERVQQQTFAVLSDSIRIVKISSVDYPGLYWITSEQVNIALRGNERTMDSRVVTNNSSRGDDIVRAIHSALMQWANSAELNRPFSPQTASSDDLELPIYEEYGDRPLTPHWDGLDMCVTESLTGNFNTTFWV